MSGVQDLGDGHMILLLTRSVGVSIRPSIPDSWALRPCMMSHAGDAVTLIQYHASHNVTPIHRHAVHAMIKLNTHLAR